MTVDKGFYLAINHPELKINNHKSWFPHYRLQGETYSLGYVFPFIFNSNNNSDFKKRPRSWKQLKRLWHFNKAQALFLNGEIKKEEGTSFEIKKS